RCHESMTCPQHGRASSGREQLLQHALHLTSGLAETARAVAAEPQRSVPLDQRPELACQRLTLALFELGDRLIQADRQARRADPARRLEKVARPGELGLRAARFVVLRTRLSELCVELEQPRERRVEMTRFRARQRNRLPRPPGDEIEEPRRVVRPTAELAVNVTQVARDFAELSG